MPRRCHNCAKSRGIEGIEKKIFMEMKDAVEWMLAKDRSLDRNTLQPYESTRELACTDRTVTVGNSRAADDEAFQTTS